MNIWCAKIISHRPKPVSRDHYHASLVHHMYYAVVGILSAIERH